MRVGRNAERRLYDGVMKSTYSNLIEAQEAAIAAIVALRRQSNPQIFFGHGAGEIAASVLVELTLALKAKDEGERLIACAAGHIAWMEETT